MLNSRQISIGNRILITSHRDHPTSIVNLVQKQAISHLILRVAQDGLSFELKLDDRDGLVHLSHELRRACKARIILKILGLENCARITTISLHGKVGQRQQIDAIPLLEGLDIGIADADTQHRGDQRPVARKSTHPEDIVVAPLDIIIAHRREDLHDLGCTRAAVEDVANDMPSIDGQGMDEVGDGYEQLLCPTRINNRINDGMEIAGAVALDTRLVEQLLDDISKILGQ